MIWDRGYTLMTILACHMLFHDDVQLQMPFILRWSMKMCPSFSDSYIWIALHLKNRIIINFYKNENAVNNVYSSCMLDNASPIVAMVMYSNNGENKLYAITLQIMIIMIPYSWLCQHNMYWESNCNLPWFLYSLLWLDHTYI
mgnify:CR=1 FL=1